MPVENRQEEPLQRTVCHCFDVPLGKLVKFHRLHQPRHASQMSQCYGAGTGCGWCIPFLVQIFEQLGRGEGVKIALSPDEYKRRRAEYRSGKPDESPRPDELSETRRMIDAVPREDIEPEENT